VKGILAKMDNYCRELRNVVVVDGDTIRATIRLGFGVELAHQQIRLFGVNAYETTRRGKWDDGLSEEEIEEKIRLGKEAGKALNLLLVNCDWVTLTSEVSPKNLTKKGKYGRWLGLLHIAKDDDVVNWNDELIARGYGYKKEY
jgi:endonuclease YncB( thermonuclease family)